MKIVLYSTGCPKCKVLEKKLDDAGVEYEVVSDTEVMLSKSFINVPVLSINDSNLKFKEAVDWINSFNKSI